MKAHIIVFLFLGLTNLSYSQSETEIRSYNRNICLENLPAMTIRSIEDSSSIYLADNNPDPKVKKLQDSFIAYDLGKKLLNYDTFLVHIEIKGSTLTATYDEKGSLVRVVEKYINVKLPSKVVHSIYKNFPEWEIVNDKYLYSQEKGDILKKQYHIRIKKGNETRKLTIHPDGEILAEI